VVKLYLAWDWVKHNAAKAKIITHVVFF